MVFKIRKKIRLKNYDYSDSGWYFVTICTKDNEYLLGNIINSKMVLNEHGDITKQSWNEIPKYFKNVELDIFQIMPNHIHGIIVIKQNNVGVSFMKPETIMNISKSNRHMGLMNQTPTLGLIIRHFKSKCTYKIHKYYLLNNKIFQRNYYEHIIRNENELNKIRQYIKDNPMDWDEDVKGGEL